MICFALSGIRSIRKEYQGQVFSKIYQKTMKIQKAHIDHIRESWKKLESKEDLINLLNEAKVFMYGENCKPIKLKSLTYYSNPKLCKKRYTSFTINKKSGGERMINAPVKGLRSILRVLNFVLHCLYEPHKAATGFVQQKSIVDNAKVHVDKHYVYNLDLKDFFHSFDRNRVKMGFWMSPFNLRDEKEPIAFLLACLCTHPFDIDGENRTVLPQGSPTSPTITNILCNKFDRRLNGLAKRFNLSYTRYADDITFSSSHNIYKIEENPVRNKKGFYNSFPAELERLIREEGLIINQSKTRLQKTGYRKEVTGLLVNEIVNVHRRYVKQLRMWLYYWEKYGYNKAEQIFLNDYKSDKGQTKKGKPDFQNVIDGKLEFLKMVKGEENSTYQKLVTRFKMLQKNPKGVKESNFRSCVSRIPLAVTESIDTLNSQIKQPDYLRIIDLIFQKGLDQAMENYKSKGGNSLTDWNIDLTAIELTEVENMTTQLDSEKQVNNGGDEN